MRGCASSAFVGSWEVAAAAETAVAYFEVSGQWRLLHGCAISLPCGMLGRITQLPHLARMLMETVASIRIFQSRRRPHERLYWNRIFLYVWPPLTISLEELRSILQRLVGRQRDRAGGPPFAPASRILRPENCARRLSHFFSRRLGVADHLPSRYFVATDPAALGVRPKSRYVGRQRGLIYPYEIIKMLTPSADNTSANFPHGEFVEHDLDADGRLLPIERPYGKNKCNIIVGVIRNFTSRYPEGIARVLLLGDPGKDLGALAEPECKRIMAALDLAICMRVPLEWFPISAGAKISMESGVENMDWIAVSCVAWSSFRRGAGGQPRHQRHQCRRPALLERRSHDADAYAWHSHHDNKGRHGAHGQTCP